MIMIKFVTVAIVFALIITLVMLNLAFIIFADGTNFKKIYKKTYNMTAICFIAIDVFSFYLSGVIITKGYTDYYKPYYQEIEDKIKIEEKQGNVNLSFNLEEKVVDKYGQEKYVHSYNEFIGQEFTIDKPIPDETIKYETHIIHINITYPYNIEETNISLKDDMTNSIRHEYEIPALNISWSDGEKNELIEKDIEEYKTKFKAKCQKEADGVKFALYVVYMFTIMPCSLLVLDEFYSGDDKDESIDEIDNVENE